MYRITLLKPVVILSFFTLTVLSRGQSGQIIPQAVAFPGGIITASIPDLHQTLDAVQAFADQVVPEESQLPIKATLGGMIGDPELSGIPRGNGALVVWDGLQWYAVIECTEQMGNALIGMASLAQLQGRYQGNFLVLSKGQESIDKGIAEGQDAIDTLLNRETVGLILHLQSSELVEKFRPQINMVMMMMPGMMAQEVPPEQGPSMQSMQSMAKILEGEIRVLTSVVSQLDSLELSVIPSKEAIEMAYLFTTREGTALHAWVTAPDILRPNPQITSEYLAPGMFEIEMFIGNPEAMVTFVKTETDKLITEMNLSPENIEKWIGMLEEWPNFFSGSMAETVELNFEKGFSMGFLVEVQDEEKLMEFISELPGQMEGFMDLYKEMGMPMEMEMNMNARTYNSYPIHQYNFRYDLENMEPVAAAELKRMNMASMNSEFALVDSIWVWSMGDPSLETLIDAQKSGELLGEPLTAKLDFGPGGLAYYDFNMASYIEFIGQMMPMDQPQALFTSLTEGLKESPPLTGAAFQQENRVLWSQKLPVEFIRAMTKLIFTGMNTAMEQPIPAQEMEIAE